MAGCEADLTQQCSMGDRLINLISETLMIVRADNECNVGVSFEAEKHDIDSEEPLASNARRETSHVC
jgi:hypothetical protein